MSRFELMNQFASVHCVVCMMDIEQDREMLPIFRERPDWKGKKNLKTADLENAYFKVPWTWGTLFRGSM